MTDIFHDSDDESPAKGETLNELAQRVLFTEAMDEKLRPLPLDTSSANTLSSGKFQWMGIIPARSSEHRFASAGALRPKLPTRPVLMNDESRGILLHFFANHELLAAELMALALLRFPDAPTEFRIGLANTLREEQRHTRWYLARMAECGVSLGQYPLSPYFWNAISPMESPLDYVSRLSLTFEQANLDYARHFSAVLSEAGDSKSASILRRIYQDEISHVSYGLHWFRQWKDPSLSDWDALEARLPYPLSPSRAKGNRTEFNAEGRRAVGFDEDYIRKLALFERSKGRTPNIFFFNPDVEQRVEHWPQSYHPDAARRAITEDLELLVGFLARKDDVLLLRHAPSEAHLEHLARHGLALPEIELLSSDGCVSRSGLLASRKRGELRPWALSPDLHERFSALSPGGAGPDLPEWTPAIRALYSKAAQHRALARWMAPGVPCTAEEEAARAIKEFREAGYEQVLLKRAYSTAGSGHQLLSTAEMPVDLKSRFAADRSSEACFLIEPFQDRVFDFSVQYQITGNEIRLIGFVEQSVKGVGLYRGSICRSKFCKDFDPVLARFLMQHCLPVYSPDGPLAADLMNWAKNSGYEGPLGIDTYVYRAPKSESGELAHRTICEVNPRYTMGRVALELKRRIAHGRDLFFFLTKPDRLTEADDSPVINEDGKLVGGSIILTERREGTKFVAVARIS